mmetsp:Transcript_24308/g.58685  ORF Transcript_24308/g.58685 Transcript_24308/m.58685 type:complete len:301 (-) Transcript_24308:455-1357(-)
MLSKADICIPRNEKAQSSPSHRRRLQLQHASARTAGRTSREPQTTRRGQAPDVGPRRSQKIQDASIQASIGIRTILRRFEHGPAPSAGSIARCRTIQQPVQPPHTRRLRSGQEARIAERVPPTHDGQGPRGGILDVHEFRHVRRRRNAAPGHIQRIRLRWTREPQPRRAPLHLRGHVRRLLHDVRAQHRAMRIRHVERAGRGWHGRAGRGRADGEGGAFRRLSRAARAAERWHFSRFEVRYRDDVSAVRGDRVCGAVGGGGEFGLGEGGYDNLGGVSRRARMLAACDREGRWWRAGGCEE